MAHAFRYLIVAPLLALSCEHAFAQTPRKAPNPVIHFAVFAPRQISGIGYFVQPVANLAAAGKPQALTFYPTRLSARYEYRGPQPIRFVDLESRATAAEAAIPPGMTEVLLLFFEPTSGADHGLHYQIAVLDASATARPSGTLIIVNLSGLELSGTVGKAAVELNAGLNAPIPVVRTTRIVANTSIKGRREQAFDSTIVVGAGQRALLLILPPHFKGTNNVETRVLVDSIAGGAEFSPATR